MIIIGIDPAFRKNGFAMCVMNTREMICHFIIFEKGYNDFMKWLLFSRPDPAFDNIYCVVENSNLTKKCWQKNAIAVGKNMAISQITVDILKTFYTEKNVIEISPIGKGAKITNLKVFKSFSKEFKLVNYLNLKKEQDKRDAFKLCYIAYQKYSK